MFSWGLLFVENGLRNRRCLHNGIAVPMFTRINQRRAGWAISEYGSDHVPLMSKEVRTQSVQPKKKKSKPLIGKRELMRGCN